MQATDSSETSVEICQTTQNSVRGNDKVLLPLSYSNACVVDKLNAIWISSECSIMWDLVTSQFVERV
jgi:hypothetical protein